MRPVRFQADSLVTLLRRVRIATMDQLKATLGTSVDMTVFRKLRTIPYRTSYSHRGRYYALDEVARFDERGDDLVAVLGVRVEPPSAWVWDAEHGQVDGELRAVPPCLGFAPAEDDDAQSGKDATEARRAPGALRRCRTSARCRSCSRRRGTRGRCSS